MNRGIFKLTGLETSGYGDFSWQFQYVHDALHGSVFRIKLSHSFCPHEHRNM
jgi:hypothetical protein